MNWSDVGWSLKANIARCRNTHSSLLEKLSDSNWIVRKLVAINPNNL